MNCPWTSPTITNSPCSFSKLDSCWKTSLQHSSASASELIWRGGPAGWHKCGARRAAAAAVPWQAWGEGSDRAPAPGKRAPGRLAELGELPRFYGEGRGGDLGVGPAREQGVEGGLDLGGVGAGPAPGQAQAPGHGSWVGGGGGGAWRGAGEGGAGGPQTMGPGPGGGGGGGPPRSGGGCRGGPGGRAGGEAGGERGPRRREMGPGPGAPAPPRTCPPPPVPGSRD